MSIFLLSEGFLSSVYLRDYPVAFSVRGEAQPLQISTDKRPHCADHCASCRHLREMTWAAQYEPG